MSSLFEPVAVGPITVKNRFVRSATGESRADAQGRIGADVAAVYAELAAGGIGLIITGHMGVHPQWRCGERQTGIWSDAQLPGLRRLAAAARANGARVAAQINYHGRTPSEMSHEDIRAAGKVFVAAARRAVAAGFDGVQIHAAHGYLLSRFLTPSDNTRTDANGGDAPGRRRLLLDITMRAREAISGDRALLCKLGAIDGRDNSLAIVETVETARQLEEAGIDAIEISSTLSGEYAQPAAEGIDNAAREAYFAPLAQAVKAAVSVPVILVGGLRSRQVMEKVVADGHCDMVSMSRPFIRELDLVNALRDGRTDAAACISCNQCYNPEGTRCVFNR